MAFVDILHGYPPERVMGEISSRGPSHVRTALGSESPGLWDLPALLSPEAAPFLEEMAQAAHSLTKVRFGRVIGLFAPLYLSSQCTNACVYCSFSSRNEISRATLTLEEVEREARHLAGQGFRHILLVSGEAPSAVSMTYLTSVLKILRPLFDSISIELYPMDTASYARLTGLGVDGLTVYQETYHREIYRSVHPAGPKSDFDHRLATPERGAAAGMRRVGIGALLGLADWRMEAFYLALHARYLMSRYWKTHVTVSFPRLRPAAGGYTPPRPVTDRDLVQMMVSLRLVLPDAGLVLSTREPARLRDNLIPLGVTLMSAGSRTAPGGYTDESRTDGQFEIADHRSAADVAAVIASRGYDPVFKDWDAAFLSG